MYMQIIDSTLQHDFSRDVYWKKVGLISDNTRKETSILLCASYEYLSNELDTEILTDVVVENWATETITEMRSRGDRLFDKTVNYEVRALTSNGLESGFIFLEEKISLPVT